MENASVPEITSAPPSPPPMPRWRWWLHLLLIGLYPVITVGIGYLAGGSARKGAMLPGTSGALLLAAATELLLFSIVFGLGWLASRATFDDLMLRWKNGLRPLWLGALYSVALRMLVVVLSIVALIAYFVYAQAREGKKSDQEMEKKAEELVSKVRPQTEVLFDFKTLEKDPVYFILMLTVISFGMAGLREELWRAGVFAAIAALFPRWYNHVAGKIFAIILVAVVFGLCHLPQGWGGVVLTGVLGLGLGAIMVFHRSTWMAVMAHGFFDATTFAMIYVIVKYFPGRIPGM